MQFHTYRSEIALRVYVDEDAEVEVDGQREPEQTDADEASPRPAAERCSTAAAQYIDAVDRRRHRQPHRQERRHQTHVRHRLIILPTVVVFFRSPALFTCILSIRLVHRKSFYLKLL